MVNNNKNAFLLFIKKNKYRSSGVQEFRQMKKRLLVRGMEPIIIAGPCSVESREQLRMSVELLRQEKRVKLVRCGVWKPRTRPGGFEGLGEKALHWMEELATETKTAFCCEVALPEHIEQCLRHGIQSVWIGARTSGDPFTLGELSEALRGTEMSVLVKNPLIPDVKLWIGAIERLAQCGISDMAAVHRGFFSYRDNDPYRNKPLWEVPIELRRVMPQLPILCDPSHIGGDRRYLTDLMQTAADLGTDGYMIEVHPSPTDALTDANQQITPAELTVLLDKIIWRKNEVDSDTELRHLRQQIDMIDRTLLQSLTQRMEISKEIAVVKARSNMAVFQPQRFEQMLEQRLVAAKELGLNEAFVKELLDKVHAESVRVQDERLKNEN